jgi:hypothetical protein
MRIIVKLRINYVVYLATVCFLLPTADLIENIQRYYEIYSVERLATGWMTEGSEFESR